MKLSIAVLAGITLPVLAQPAPYEKYILAPTSRTLHAVSVRTVNGTVQSPEFLTQPATSGTTTFEGDSGVTIDYGKNIGGFAAIRFGANQSASCIGVTFSESSLWISGTASDATAGSGLGNILWLCPENANSDGVVMADKSHDRGSFRCVLIPSFSLIDHTSTQIHVPCEERDRKYRCS